MKTNLIQGDYKVFAETYDTQMPLLIKEGLQPLTTKDLLEYRIKAIQSKDENEIDFWLNCFFNTITGLAYHDGKLIIKSKSDLLLGINANSKLSQHGSLILSPEQYEQLIKENEVIKRNKIISKKNLTKQEAKEHPVWLKLAQDDKHLLNEYIDIIFAEAKSKYHYNKIMGVYLPEDETVPALRPWCIGYLYYNKSKAEAFNYLGDMARLLGVRTKNLEEKVSNN